MPLPANVQLMLLLFSLLLIFENACISLSQVFQSMQMLIAMVRNILYPTRIKWQTSSSDDIMVNDLSGHILHSCSVLKQQGTLGRTFE